MSGLYIEFLTGPWTVSNMSEPLYGYIYFTNIDISGQQQSKGAKEDFGTLWLVGTFWLAGMFWVAGVSF